MAGMGNPNNIKRIEEAIARGFDVDVYAFDGQRDGPRDPEGVEVHMIPGYTSDLPYWKRIGKVVSGLKSVINNYKKDECVYYLFRNDKAIIFTMLTNRPYIFEEADMTHANIKNSLVRNWFERRLRKVIRKSVVSAFRSEGFLQYHFGDKRPENVYVIPNRLHAGIVNIPTVEYTGLDEKHLRFGFVGGVRYDTIYKFYDNDKWYTTLKKNGRRFKFHLGYWKEFGDIRDVEWFQYLEDRGCLMWKGGNRYGGSHKDLYEENETSSDYSVWDALEDNPEAAGNIDYEM